MNIETNQKNNFLKKLLIILGIIITIIFLIIVYARYKSTSGLKIYEYKITNNQLPESFHGIKIVHISDIYLGNTVDTKYLTSIANKINKLKPDIIVFTGDLGDTSEYNKNEIITILSSINYTIGKFAIKGDNDNELFDEIMSSSKFTNLTGTSKEIYYKSDKPILISNVNQEYDGVSILLLHEPDKIEEFNSFSLALAGHSLNGQINIPLIKKLFLSNGSKKYYDKYYKINETDFYISSGIGTTKFKYRFNNKPSINLYRLTKY